MKGKVDKGDNAIEGNKLIAESPFCEEVAKNTIDHYRRSGNEYGLNDYIASLDFNSSWNRLMPVVEKIKNYSPDHEIEITIGKTFCRIYFRNLDDGRYLYGAEAIKENPIEAIWLAVVEFIKWYNNKNK